MRSRLRGVNEPTPSLDLNLDLDLDLDDPSTDPFTVADAAAAVVAERTGSARHDVALVLGSGWGRTGDLIGETLTTIDNADVPGFHPAAVAGHSGTMRSIAIGDTGRRALVYGTRTHFYEGRGVRGVVHAVRTAKAAGCSVIVLTNGCGGLNPAWSPGTPVLISDHLNLTAASPIEGANFVDLTDLYSTRLRTLAREVDGTLDEGVYVSSAGRTTRPRPRCGWPGSSAATSWGCRRPSRRSPPASRAWRCWASRW